MKVGVDISFPFYAAKQRSQIDLAKRSIEIWVCRHHVIVGSKYKEFQRLTKGPMELSSRQYKKCKANG